MERRESLVAIVDDDPAVLRALGRLTRSLGFETEAYASGEAMLAGIGVPPRCILLDLHLPGLRGPDVIAALRDRGILAPVVVMTGLDRPGSREACLAAGADAYITKPIRRDDLWPLLAHPEAPA